MQLCWISSRCLAVDLSIRRGESQGVIHDSLIDEDFNLIWFVNFNCPQTAFAAVFFNTRPWNLREGGGCRLPLNNGNLSVPLELTRSSSKARLKVCWSPWAAEAWFNVYHIFHLHIQPVFSCFTFSQIKRLHVKKGGVLGSFHASRQNQLLWSKLPNLTLPLYLNLHKCSFEYNKSIHLLSNPDVLIRDLHLHVQIIKMSSVFLLSGKNLQCVHVCVLKKKKQC